MSANPKPSLPANDALQSAVASAIDSVAPNWPLDRMIAVNPYWGRIQQPFETAASDLANIAGSAMTFPLKEYREAWQRGEITSGDLRLALEESQLDWNLGETISMLDEEHPVPLPLPLFSDSLDRMRDLQRKPAWCDTITHQVSQFCAAYFDRDQADWHPDQGSRLFSSWRGALIQDHSVALLMHTPQISARARTACCRVKNGIAGSCSARICWARAWLAT